MFTSNNLDDSELARLLQEEYDREVLEDDPDEDRDESLISGLIAKATDIETSDAVSSLVSILDESKPFVSSRQSVVPELSPVDPSLELSDPTPDILVLFLDFNKRYFWGSLAGIEVKWSPRMTLCAGLCVYEGRGGLCSVRLSLPLLKLRPRKDLVETLLHEMIHAYLFITDNDRDHSGHGRNFLAHMHRLNKATGANISVYHTFNDEVDSYQQHWWRCNGPCQQKAPYFGYVKRSMNRAPSASDFWWPEHQATCGGVYTKIKEPVGYGQKKLGKGKGKGTFNATEPSKDIQAFWGKGHSLSSTTEANNKPGGRSLSEGKSWTQSTSAATFSGGIGPRNPKTGQTSVGGALSKPAFDHASDPLARYKSEVSPSLPFKHSGNNHKDKFSTSVNAANFKTRISANSNNTFSDIRKDNFSQPTKRKSTDSHNASSETRTGNNNSRSEFHKIFNNSFSSNRMWKHSPHVDNKKVIFPKDFVSVCVGGDSSGPAVSSKKKKKKYIIDELDSNDGLWEETVDLTADVNVGELSKELKSVGQTSKLGSVKNLDKASTVLNKLPAGLADRRSDGTSPEKKSSPKRKPFQAGAHSSDKTVMKTNEIKNGIGAVKSGKSGDLSFHVGTRPGFDNLGSQSSVSKSGSVLFTGQGYKLGTGKGGSSFLSEMRKTWQQKSSSTPSTSGRELSHSSPSSRLFSLSHTDQVNASSSLPNNKRKSMEAFGVQEVNHSDSSKIVKIDKEVTSYNHSNIRHASVSERLNEVNVIEAASTHVKVPCPVCNVLVPENTINAHLDLCLLNS